MKRKKVSNSILIILFVILIITIILNFVFIKQAQKVKITGRATGIINVSVVDITAPTITLISPADGYSTPTTTITFSYIVTDTSNISNCSLIINGVTEQTDTSITKDTTQSFSKTLSVGSFIWQISCTNEFGNKGESAKRNIFVEGGGGGLMCLYKWNCTDWSECLPQGIQTRICTNIGTCPDNYRRLEEKRNCTYVPSFIGDIEKEKEVLFSLYEKGQAIFIYNETNHTIILAKLYEKSVDIVISSVELTLAKGEEKGVDLDENGVNDISLILENIKDNKAYIKLVSVLPAPSILMPLHTKIIIWALIIIAVIIFFVIYMIYKIKKLARKTRKTRKSKGS